MKIKRAKGDKAKCDDLVRKILRTRYSSCQRCGSRDNLQVSHIVSRRYSATRCDLDNLQILCARDHFYFTHWPKEFSRWITASIGVEAYEELKRKAETVTKMDWSEEKLRLQELLDLISENI
jgi:5-methylcytosine-specific restriction endonuclease McrA